MHGARLTGFALLIAVLGGGCSRKRSEPAPSQEARAGSAVREDSAAIDAGAVDAPASDASPDAAPEPTDSLAERFAERYLPTETVPEEVQERIRAHLRGKSKAPIALPYVIHARKPGGGHEVFAIYEYSVYEDCVRRYRTAKEAREHCSEDWSSPAYADMGPTDGHEELARQEKECVALGAVRATFAPMHPEMAGATPGAMTAASIAFANTLCKVDKYHHLFVADVDHDKRLELYVDLSTMKLESSGTRMGNTERQQRDLFIWDGGPEADIEIRLGDSSQGWFTDHSAEHIELRDVDGNGHLDLIQLGPSSSEKTVHFYGRAGDTWSPAAESAPPPGAGSADTPTAAGSAATPASAGSADTPTAAGSADTPTAAGSAATPASAGSAATPTPAGSPAKPTAPVPATQPAAGNAAKP